MTNRTSTKRILNKITEGFKEACQQSIWASLTKHENETMLRRLVKQGMIRDYSVNADGTEISFIPVMPCKRITYYMLDTKEEKYTWL